MREVYRAKQGNGRTQVQYQLEEDEYDWLLYNLARLLDEVKDTGAILTVSAKAIVDTDSDSDSTPPADKIAGVVNKSGVTLGYESVEYHFMVRVNVPLLPENAETPETE